MQYRVKIPCDLFVTVNADNPIKAFAKAESEAFNHFSHGHRLYLPLADLEEPTVYLQHEKVDADAADAEQEKLALEMSARAWLESA